MGNFALLASILFLVLPIPPPELHRSCYQQQTPHPHLQGDSAEHKPYPEGDRHGSNVLWVLAGNPNEFDPMSHPLMGVYPVGKNTEANTSKKEQVKLKVRHHGDTMPRGAIPREGETARVSLLVQIQTHC
jgi:hypothetical protein